jgi:putative hydrolase of the HAD superfamily
LITILNNLIKNKPEMIVFDTDNTIYPYDPAHKYAMKAVIKKISHSYGICEKDFIYTFNKARRVLKKNLGNTASSHSRLLYFQKTLELLGYKTQIFDSLDLEEIYWSNFLLKANLFHNLTDFFNDIRALNIKLSIITDLTVQIQFRKLIFFSLDQYCDFVVTSEESGADKPKNNSFNLLREKSGLKKSKNILMIGDDKVKDIYAAKKNGFLSLQKVHKGVDVEKNIKRTDGYFNSYTDLRIFVKKYWN